VTRHRHVNGLLARGIDAYLGARRLELQRALFARLRRGRRRFDLFLRPEDGHALLLAQALPAIARAADAEIHRWLISPQPVEVDPEPRRRRAWTVDDGRRLSDALPGMEFPSVPRVPTEAAIAATERALADRGWHHYVELSHALLAGADVEAHGSGAARVLRRAGDAMLASKGHYQPAMVHYEGEWYWGIDRLWHLAERLEAEGCAVDAPSPRPSTGSTEGPLVTYVSFRSPYSYLAVARLQGRDDVELRPVLPMVMRGYRVPRVKRLYIARDAAREARRWKVPFGRLTDPLGPGIARCIATFFDQPDTLRSRVSHAIMRGIWSQAADVSGPDLERLVKEAGGTWREPDVSDGAPWRSTVARHREELGNLGLWGVPSFHRGDLRLWGQDRVPWI